MAATTYPLVQAYFEAQGLYKKYVRAEVGRARQDGAPADAVYYSDHRREWVTFSELPDSPLKRRLAEARQ